MYVRRIPKPNKNKAAAPTIFFFEPHYALSRSYAQEVVLHNVQVPTIDGFQCPTVEQGAEQNALCKAILFSPWRCTQPVMCGKVITYSGLMANDDPPKGSVLQPAGGYTFQRAWRLRSSEILTLAERAQCRCMAARKRLVLADTTLFANMKEPKSQIEEGEKVRNILVMLYLKRLQRSPPGHAVRTILAFLGLPCKWHEEQCTVAEFTAFIARDVLAHIDLAAEARVKKPRQQLQPDESDSEVEDDLNKRQRLGIELVDMGGGDNDDDNDATEDIPLGEVSSFPLTEVSTTLSLCFQEADVAALDTKKRKSKSDVSVRALHNTYASLLQQDFSLESKAQMLSTHGFGKSAKQMIALQKCTIELAKKQEAPDDDANEDDFNMPSSASQPAEPQLVPVSLANQGPAVVALKLLTDSSRTEEQIDAVALVALSMQKRFEKRPDKSSNRLPVATSSNNHRALWLGGGGVGKTDTLLQVVEPLAETYFGPEGYCATAHANAAAQNLGAKGRTLYSANGLLMRDSLQTARLDLKPQTQKKMDRITGSLGVDVIDEVGALAGDLLHADALRRTYGRALRHNLDPLAYMKPQETWGRMPIKLLCGDFFQLPPVPASASLLAPGDTQSYEQLQGKKLLTDIEYVVDFRQMRRFDDPLLIEVLEAMRIPGGKRISEEAWRAIQSTEIKETSVSQPGAIDERLRDARNWYECAYEWRIVSYAMHAHARLNAKADGKLLYYIPSIDIPTVRMGRTDFDDMRSQPNISNTAKFPGILPIYMGMEMCLTETYLPPRIGRGAPVDIVGIELHPMEPPIEGRASIASHGCVVLRYMPKQIYVRVKNCDSFFLVPNGGATQPGLPDLKGVIAVRPQSRTWLYKNQMMKEAVYVSRTQMPLLPRKQCSLHGIQGKTADPGFIAHWSFPTGLTKQSIWLAYYVSLSRPRSLSKMLSHGLPDRDIIEGGPPQSIADAFHKMFDKKIAKTKVACVRARAQMGWPARPG